jgi:hypothetical protein
MGQTSGEQHRNMPQMVMALRVAARKRVRVVARLAKGMTRGCTLRLAAIPFCRNAGHETY